ncbi:hypothetical protein [Geitlerinema sp. PCC 7407]|uniref:hypothetical protein n=1 Tax=Geitlerinema sp. PCC 7407 TaxID=1173025 RepID=UPI0012374F7E|nr:hypothetical protein [Geitlerinema sp. PCC 7407]
MLLLLNAGSRCCLEGDGGLTKRDRLPEGNDVLAGCRPRNAGAPQRPSRLNEQTAIAICQFKGSFRGRKRRSPVP